MTELNQPRKVKAGPRTIEDEIAAAEEKLRKLRERKREEDIKARERNTKAVLELLRNEKLDLVQSSVWESALPKIREALYGADSSAPAEPVVSGTQPGQVRSAEVAGSAKPELPAAAAA